jgi:hypothetical protein
MFKGALQFEDIIILCYSRHNTIIITSKVPPSFDLAFLLNNCGLFFSYCECMCFELVL